MKKVLSRLLVSTAIILVVGLVAIAQSQFSSWPFYIEITTNGQTGLYQFTVPLGVFGASRDDLGDLRLFDSQNHEVPYAIRVRRGIDEQRETATNVFNEVTIGDSTTEATLDLGENPGEHNQVLIHTAGRNYRRRVAVEGSNSGTDWRTLNGDGLIFAFQAQGKLVESSQVNYPISRFRYLRVRVRRDELSDERAPDITELKVLMSVRDQGEFTTWNVPVPAHQLNRNQGAHSSSWTIDLGTRLPCERLILNIADSSFFRPFEVENIDNPQKPRLLANGNLSRRADEENSPLMITFDNEENVRRLRLQITDYSNPTLTIVSIQASAPARELVFELKQPQRLPLRLYFGNSRITEPHYDFEKELSSKSKSPVMVSSIGEVTNNPSYTPEPLPFTERLPWLIYLVLAASSIGLGLILLSLARATLKTRPANKSASNDSSP